MKNKTPKNRMSNSEEAERMSNIEQEEKQQQSAAEDQEEFEQLETVPPEEVSLSGDEMLKIIQEKEDCYDRLLRTQADFDNYRKRTLKEQGNLIKYGAENALREILPVVDNLERAVEAARNHGDPDSKLREGMELILSHFLDILRKLGVSPVETVGRPFDPTKHDALIRVHNTDVEEGAVVEEIRKGYYLHDKVLRPAQVTVGTHEKV